MKILIIIFLSITIGSLIYFFYLGYKSQSGTANGLLNGKLTPCSNKPNCICSEYPNDSLHFSEAIAYQDLNLDALAKTIKLTGGKITNNENNYISATYTSRLFRYIDDFEIRIDTENKLIHIRSASRVGHSDMGANLKRIMLFKETLKSQ